MKSTTQEPATDEWGEPIAAPQALPPQADANEDLAQSIVMPDGEIVDADDPDSLIDAYERIEAIDSKVYQAKVLLKQALAKLSTGDKKTRRVGGKRRTVVVTMPSPGWSQSLLKEAYNSYPQFRDELLRVDTIGVKARELGKARETSKPTDQAWETFRNMIVGAETPPSGNPTIKIEK